MSSQPLNDTIKVDMAVRTVDGAQLGTVAEVWPDVGVGESWGASGSMPQTGAEATDSEQLVYSEAMPGEGDSYFRVRTPAGDDLYVPFSAVGQAEGDVVEVAVDEDSVPGMQWDVIPNFVNVTSETDSQGASNMA
jgi:hypothetical protein